MSDDEKYKAFLLLFEPEYGWMDHVSARKEFAAFIKTRQRFNCYQALEYINQALKPVVEKYQNYIEPYVVAQYEEELISAYEALRTVIDPILDREFGRVKKK